MSKVFLVQARGPEFDPQHPCTEPNTSGYAFDSRSGVRVEEGRSQASQSRRNGEL